ncbi:MAG: hypothetical protein E2O39_13000 [Planctomycetota bacterium]|nr:MAG: hypothetical protein E2O39_13000 [Planctomycetota bacterium]
MKTLITLLTALLPLAVPARGQAELPDVKGAADQALRWLRSTQDLETGRYGDGVETTAWVLRAFAVSPRKYAIGDGPFMRAATGYLVARQTEDGAIHDVDATDPERIEQTRLASEVFALLPDESTNVALARARAWMTSRDVEATPDPAFAAQDRERALRRTIQLLAERRPDGTWGAEDRILRTAKHIVELSRYYDLLQPKSAPGAVKPLPALAEVGTVDAKTVDESLLRGARFLMRAAEDGRWGAPGRPDAGLTSMVLAALQTLPEPRPADVQKTITDGLAWLASLQREDGSIHDGKLANYITSSAILALARSGDPQYSDAIGRAREFLVSLQADEGEGYSSDHPYYGGIGYGGDERPDLSNLQMALEALSASGLEQGHAAYERAIAFLERCQNRSESNDVAIVKAGVTYASGDDGGAAYMPGNSPAGYVELEDGRKLPRSYGSMTYALLKGYIFAGVSKDDPRMKACWDWLQAHYSLDVNPGFEFSSDPTAAYQGLFYYFHTMARAIDLYGVDVVVDADGREQPWRDQLCGRLLAMQSKLDGSWVNVNAPRWWEGNPILATAYALLTLDAARK